MDGFIIYHDKEWVMLIKEYDFTLNGVVLIRKEDITSIKSGKTQAFHKKLMQQDRTLPGPGNLPNTPGVGIPEFLASLPKDKVVIFEEETADEEDNMFYIGLIEKAEDKEVHLRFFSTEAVLDEELTVIDLDDITSISYDSSYTLAYEHHFQRENGKNFHLPMMARAAISWALFIGAAACLSTIHPESSRNQFWFGYLLILIGAKVRQDIPFHSRSSLIGLIILMMTPLFIYGVLSTSIPALYTLGSAALIFIASIVYEDIKHLRSKLPHRHP